jgi:hypothetical protein
MIQPSIPTDNLYKFLAISGLVICISSYWFPRQLDDTITPKIIQARAELEDLAERLAEQAGIPQAVARFGLIKFDASTLNEDRGTDLGFGSAFDRFEGSALASGSQRGA